MQGSTEKSSWEAQISGRAGMGTEDRVPAHQVRRAGLTGRPDGKDSAYSSPNMLPQPPKQHKENTGKSSTGGAWGMLQPTPH